MTTSVKPPKDKTCGATPRLTPRPTAASAARAARNATNRNVSLHPSQRQSPSRGPPSPSSAKGKSPIQRNIQKLEPKPEVKESRTFQQEDYTSDSYIFRVSAESRWITGGRNRPGLRALYWEVSTKQEPDTYDIIEIGSTVIIEETSEERINYDNAENNESTIFEITSHDINYNELSLDTVGQTREGNRSLPPTPVVSSRPSTPMNTSSRPPTPRVVSRPGTPAHQLTRSATPNRPNTPQRIPTPTQSKTPNYIRVPSPPGTHTSNSIDNLRDKEDIKTAYTAKQKQFNSMKRELDLKQTFKPQLTQVQERSKSKAIQCQKVYVSKQLGGSESKFTAKQAVLEVFDCLRGMRERMAQEGVSGSGEGIQEQELVVFNVADWSTEEITQLCRDAAASSCADGAVNYINTTTPIDECAIEELDAKIVDVPTRFADLCFQAIRARQELINWVKELIEMDENGGGESSERIAHYNAQGLELCEALNELKNHANDAVDTATQLSKRAFRERNALIVVGESLVREIARLRDDLDVRTNVLNEVREIRTETETSKMLEETRREVDEERAAKAALNNKLASTEAQLRQARGRINKMDRQLREADASITSLTATVKSLEDQSRQKEVQLEARARKLRESLKTGEVTSSQLAQHRDALQAEILELKEQIEKMTTEHKIALTDLNNDLKVLKNALVNQEIMTENEMKCKEDAETALAVSQITIEDLKSKITKLENSMPNPDLPTEREMDLWAELQATKETLHMTEDEVTVCKREKIRFLETMTKITESDNKVGIQQKLAAELLSKEEIISKMQIQIRELTKNIKLHEQKVIQYEQYVRDLQAHNRAVANCQEAPNGISYQDLQQEIMNLKMSLLEAVHRNEELSEIMVQKEQQLEQQDKTSRAQARVIKVREELINMLKNKETEQSRELASLQQDLEHRMKIVEEVNKQIAAKAEEIQELFATLENKQQQIHRLEKIVLALEEQQRRAQTQRTRHEEKIAALEHELASGGNRRERKFIFF